MDFTSVCVALLLLRLSVVLLLLCFKRDSDDFCRPCREFATPWHPFLFDWDSFELFEANTDECGSSKVSDNDMLPIFGWDGIFVEESLPFVFVVVAIASM